MRIPRRFFFRLAANEAIDAEIAERLVAVAENAMIGAGGNTNHIAGFDRMTFCAIADLQQPFAFHHVKDLLGVVVNVKWWRFAGFEHDDEHL